jgi:NAD(P)-dependent dehydrogenase (short-subunit alcohol dehydrogenase family)
MAGRSASGLAGKAFIGTGAGRGIGEAVAKLLAAEAVHGVVNARTGSDA